MDQAPVVGWYGKLPSLGDFASRRLLPEFIEAWDDWLAAGLSDWREREPDAWLEHYLAGPSWRFLLMPGVLGSGSWTGVLMPSVDRVGRYFPLTLAQPLPLLPPDAEQTAKLLAWLQQLDDLALDALQDDWTLDQLEAELQRLGGPPAPDAPQDLTPSLDAEVMLELHPRADVASLLAAMARSDLLHSLHGKVLWLCTDALGQPLLRVTDGLPQARAFSELMTRPVSTPTESPPPLSSASLP
ncbi:MAG: type VI secretion system-associated protein TagF [Burkholderiaceae bacterium]|nr:type VI secretion system-associated protein TagF [Burkholderiaceae bacterium]MBT9500405.1 type VI secretion system-associated protein TagF [Burkholderiaceae bacterium]